MELHFRATRLRRCFEESALAMRRWGPDAGRNYIRRLNRIQFVERWDDLYAYRDLDLHPLHGDRAGEFAIRLTAAMRLIVRRGATVGDIVIVNVEDYHG